MITRTVWVLSVLLLVTGPRAEAQTALECRKGQVVGSRDLGGGDQRCDGAGRGLAIDVGPATYAYTDNPECPQGPQGFTDRIMRETARLASSVEPPADWIYKFTSFWNSLLDRTSSFGNDFDSLAKGKLVGKGGARCQIFVIPVPVPATAITDIRFQTLQGGKVLTCYRTKPTTLKTSGSCEIGWSGWQSVVVEPDKYGTLVAAVFKNWSSNLRRTGVLWVYY